MKKKLLFLTAILYFSIIPALAFEMQNQSSTGSTSQSKTVQLKQLADEYASIQLGENKGSTQKILKDMVTLGASDFKTMTYTPCPYRGMIKVGGKSVNGTNRKCVDFKYTYKNKEYSAGKGGQPIRSKNSLLFRRDFLIKILFKSFNNSLCDIFTARKYNTFCQNQIVSAFFCLCFDSF